jgi:hypothetical protein
MGGEEVIKINYLIFVFCETPGCGIQFVNFRTLSLIFLWGVKLLLQRILKGLYAPIYYRFWCAEEQQLSLHHILRFWCAEEQQHSLHHIVRFWCAEEQQHTLHHIVRGGVGHKNEQPVDCPSFAIMVKSSSLFVVPFEQD